MEISTIKNKMSDFSEAVKLLKPLEELQDLCRDSTKTLYDYIKAEEILFGTHAANETLQKLHIKNMSAEQIWQQIEIQNNFLISDLNSETPLSDSNLCVQIAKLSNEVRTEVEKQSEKEDDTSDDEGVEMAEGEESSDQENEGEHQSDSVVDDEKELHDENEFSDLDADTFGDIVLGDDDCDEDELLDDSEDDHLDDRKTQEETYTSTEIETKKKSFVGTRIQQKKFKPTPVDSQFLSLRECEWVADNDLIAEGDGSKDDFLDLMDSFDAEKEDEKARNAMYSEFFDPVDPVRRETTQGEDETYWEEGSIEDEETDELVQGQQQQQDNSSDTAEEASKFENALKEGGKFLDKLEVSYLADKPWTLKGEVEKRHRPENSTLEEHLDYDVVIRQKPLITEETSEKIEKLLLTLIRTLAWDDVERRIKPNLDPFKLKRNIILDQEKSKKSLSDIYEQDFIKKQEEGKSGDGAGSSILTGPAERVDEPTIHKEIRKEMKDLFLKLDALSNYHYTPKFKDAEVKVISNLPTITIEESTPTIASDATLLAPQEIIAPLRGDLKGDSEKTSTDKKSQRRSKKTHQRAKARRENEKLTHQLKQRGKDGLLKTDASVKFVQKALKKGQLKMLEGSNDKAKTSSTAFFNELQTISSSKRKNENEDSQVRKKKKKGKEMTLAQLLL